MRGVQLLRILSNSIPERPILFLNLYEIDEYVLGTKPQSGMESVGHGLVERFLLLDGSTGVERQLDKDAILSASNAKIVFVGDQRADRMLGDDLETVVLGRFQGLDHRLIDDVADRATIFGGLSLDEINACERHVRSLLTGVDCSSSEPSRAAAPSTAH